MKVIFLIVLLISFIKANSQNYEFDNEVTRLNGIFSCTVSDHYNEIGVKISEVYRFDSLGRVKEITNFDDGHTKITKLEYNGNDSWPISKSTEFKYSPRCYGLREYPTKYIVVREQFGKIKCKIWKGYLYQKLMRIGNKTFYNQLQTRIKYKYKYDQTGLLTEVKPSKKTGYIKTTFTYK